MSNISKGDWSSFIGAVKKKPPTKESKEEDVITVARPEIDFNRVLNEWLEYMESSPSKECYDLLINLKRTSNSYNALIEHEK